MTPETIKDVLCIIIAILILYWKVFGGKNRDR